jgi:hypothetical protein
MLLMNTPANSFVLEMNSAHNKTIGLKTVEALRHNHFDAEFFETAAEALDRILLYIKPMKKVAFGGSQTIRQLGLGKIVAQKKAEILDHNKEGLGAEEKMEIMREQQVCDVFICSSNAITLNGELYNVDGNGNRISALIFGPKKVIVVAGINKICPDESSAWQRIKFLAAPINMQRLNRPNPCTKQGICMDCSLSTRGCNAYLVLRKKPGLTDISVFIINEVLGF